jgi:hypothetical protein
MLDWNGNAMLICWATNDILSIELALTWVIWAYVRDARASIYIMHDWYSYDLLMGIVDFFLQHAVHKYSAMVYSEKSMAAMAEQKCFKDDDQIGTVIFELGNLDAQMPQASNI